MGELSRRLADVRARIKRAAERAGREPDEIRIIGIAKTFPAASVLEALAAGLSTFGENRVQEAAQKIPEVAAVGGAPSEWHLVGSLQRNKAAAAVRLFDVIQSVDRSALALALDRAAAQEGKIQKVLLQVNIDREPQKGGSPPEQLGDLLDQVDSLPNLEPVGLMAVPRACTDPQQVRPSFARLRDLLQELNRKRARERPLRVLSMGMSADFEIAIEEGATWVRIGSAIFGERRSG